MSVLSRTHPAADAIPGSRNSIVIPSGPRTYVSLVETLLGLGRFADAKTAADRAIELPHLDDRQKKAIKRHEEIARRLAPLRTRLAPSKRTAKCPRTLRPNGYSPNGFSNTSVPPL